MNLNLIPITVCIEVNKIIFMRNHKFLSIVFAPTIVLCTGHQAITTVSRIELARRSNNFWQVIIRKFTPKLNSKVRRTKGIAIIMHQCILNYTTNNGKNKTEMTFFEMLLKFLFSFTVFQKHTLNDVPLTSIKNVQWWLWFVRRSVATIVTSTFLPVSFEKPVTLKRSPLWHCHGAPSPSAMLHVVKLTTSPDALANLGCVQLTWSTDWPSGLYLRMVGRWPSKGSGVVSEGGHVTPKAP